MIALIGPLSFEEFLVVYTSGLGLLCVIPFSMIFNKAGFSPRWALIALVPFGIVVLPFLLTFMEWPVSRTKDD